MTPDPNLLKTLQKFAPEAVAVMEKRLGFNLGNLENELDKFVGVSDTVVKLKNRIRRLALYDDPVLIQGETGTGKEVLARALAAASPGFIGINCAGMPRELIESELFGFSKGAFTGAGMDRDGLLKQAGKGVFMLDEIGDMPLDMQSKLLRVLQERTVRPVGSAKEVPIECRFVAASHFDLTALMKEGKFRTDLLARLSTFTLYIPPLRERLGDAIVIWNKLAGDKCAVNGNMINWSQVDLTFNVRSVIQLYRRFIVEDEKPPLIK